MLINSSSHLFTENKIYHLSFFHRTVRSRYCWSKQYAGRGSNMNLVYGLALHEFSVAQWIERPPGVCPKLVTCWLFHLHNLSFIVHDFNNWMTVIFFTCNCLHYDLENNTAHYVVLRWKCCLLEPSLKWLVRTCHNVSELHCTRKTADHCQKFLCSLIPLTYTDSLNEPQEMEVQY